MCSHTHTTDKHGLDNIEDRIRDEFNSLIVLPSDIDSITRLDEPTSADHYGTLVRWTAMVQDTGYGTEMYLSTSTSNKCLVYGANQDEVGGEQHARMHNLDDQRMFNSVMMQMLYQGYASALTSTLFKYPAITVARTASMSIYQQDQRTSFH